MRLPVLIALAACVLALTVPPPAAAEGGRRLLGAEEAVAWRAVGRLNIAGKRFCTATLVAPDVALTAAHCLYNPATKRGVRPSEIRFVAGLRVGGFAAARRVRAVATPPGYVYDGEATLSALAADVALVALDGPVSAEEAAPFATARFDPRAAMTLVSYARDRAHAPSIERDCDVRQTLWPVAALACDVVHGASGAPVFATGAGEPRVVAVVSALGRADGRRVALTVAVEPLVERLMADLGRAPAVGVPAPRPARS